MRPFLRRRPRPNIRLGDLRRRKRKTRAEFHEPDETGIFTPETDFRLVEAEIGSIRHLFV